MKILLTILVTLSASVGAWAGLDESVNSDAQSWKGLFMSGDHSIPNFDRGRIDLGSLLEEYGLASSAQEHFTVDLELANDGGATILSPQHLEIGFSKFKDFSAPNRGCFVHMTSHGIRDAGFVVAQPGSDDSYSVLPPRALQEMVNENCGDEPTVVLVSACFSGQFITPGLTGPNRIVLTASHRDRTSFGCSEDTTYTYWDGCLLDAFPESDTWGDLHENVKICVSAKEAQIGVRPSLPQGFFGENVKNMRIFHK